MFISGAIGCYAAAIATSDYVKNSKLDAQVKDISFKSRTSLLLHNPGIWWIASDSIAGFSANSFVDITANNTTIGFFTVGALASIYGLKRTYNQLFVNNTKKPEASRVFDCLLSTTQLAAFAVGNVLTGNFTRAVCLGLWSASSLMMARQIDETEYR